MEAIPAGKNILILSDNPLLARAIELNLSGSLTMRVRHWEHIFLNDVHRTEPSFRADLIIVAMSSLAHDPMAALVGCGLASQIDVIPMVVISANPFYVVSHRRIAQLGFPFDPQHLLSLVDDLLGAQPAPTL